MHFINFHGNGLITKVPTIQIWSICKNTNTDERRGEDIFGKKNIIRNFNMKTRSLNPWELVLKYHLSYHICSLIPYKHSNQR